MSLCCFLAVFNFLYSLLEILPLYFPYLNVFDADDEINLMIGNGKREYPVADIQKGILGSKLVFATEGFANWKRKKQELI